MPILDICNFFFFCSWWICILFSMTRRKAFLKRSSTLGFFFPCSFFFCLVFFFLRYILNKQKKTVLWGLPLAPRDQTIQCPHPPSPTIEKAFTQVKHIKIFTSLNWSCENINRCLVWWRCKWDLNFSEHLITRVMAECSFFTFPWILISSLTLAGPT